MESGVWEGAERDRGVGSSHELLRSALHRPIVRDICCNNGEFSAWAWGLMMVSEPPSQDIAIQGAVGRTHSDVAPGFSVIAPIISFTLQILPPALRQTTVERTAPILREKKQAHRAKTEAQGHAGYMDSEVNTGLPVFKIHIFPPALWHPRSCL